MSNENTVMEQDLSIASRKPEYYSDLTENTDYYRKGSFWRTEEGFVRMEEMDTEHLLRARRMAMRKVAEHYHAAQMHEAKAETFLLKVQQFKAELERRNILSVEGEEERYDLELVEV